MSADQFDGAFIERKNFSFRIRDRNADWRLGQNGGQEFPLQGERAIRLPNVLGGLPTNTGHCDRA